MGNLRSYQFCGTDNAAEMQVRLMMEEGTRFQDLVHQNIYPLIGIVDGDGCRPLLVYPSVTYGNLKRLHLTRNNSGRS